MNSLGGFVKSALSATVQHANVLKPESKAVWRSFQSFDKLPGLYYLENAVTESQEASILTALKGNSKLFPEGWEQNTRPKRRQEMFGWPLRLRAKETDFTPMPTWATEFWSHLQKSSDISDLIDTEKEPVDSFVVIKYENGMGIHDHMDEEDFYGSYVIGLCLNLDAEMAYAPLDDPYTASPLVVPLPARSVYLLTGAARYQYLHGIRTRDLPGALRVSVTIRHHKESFLSEENRKLKPILPRERRA